VPTEYKLKRRYSKTKIRSGKSLHLGCRGLGRQQIPRGLRRQGFASGGRRMGGVMRPLLDSSESEAPRLGRAARPPGARRSLREGWRRGVAGPLGTTGVEWNPRNPCASLIYLYTRSTCQGDAVGTRVYGRGLRHFHARHNFTRGHRLKPIPSPVGIN
jgi:hypothetical protein